MNPKIQVLLDKFKSNPKLAPWLEKSQKGLRRVQFFTAIFLLIFVGSLLSGFVFLALQPQEKFQTWLQKVSVEILGAKSARVLKSNWSFSSKAGSAGISFINVEVKESDYFQNFFCPELKVHIEIAQFIRGKFPITVSCESVSIYVEEKPERLLSLEPATVMKKFPKWVESSLSKLFLKIEFNDLNLYVGKEQELELKKGTFFAKLSGFPGSFSGFLKSEAELDAQHGSLVGSGEIGVEFEGHAHSVKGTTQALVLDQFDVDLSEMAIHSDLGFEKTAELEFIAKLPFRMGVDPGLVLKDFKFSEEASVISDEIKLQILSEYSFFSNTGFLRAVLPRQNVEHLKLPHEILRKTPLKGLVELNAEMRVLNGEFNAGAWKIFLNNLVFDPAAMPFVYREQKSDEHSSGAHDTGGHGAGGGHGGEVSTNKIRLSFATEGFFRDGKIDSPKMELHLNGTDSDFFAFDGYFRKPKGEAFTLFATAQIKDNIFKLENFRAALNTLNIQGRAELKDFNQALFENAGMLELSFLSNRINMAAWSQSFPSFKKLPVEGILELGGSLRGKIGKYNDWSFQELSWVVSRAVLSKFRGAFDPESHRKLGLPDHMGLRGPFAGEFFFQGRGRGTGIDQGTLVSQLDLTHLGFFIANKIKKPIGIPLVASLSAQFGPNRVSIQNGQLKFKDVNLQFSGNLVKGSSRNNVEILLNKPVQLSEYKDFFPRLNAENISGLLTWNGKFVLSSSAYDAPERIHFQDIGLRGDLELSKVHGLLTFLDIPVNQFTGKIQFDGDNVEISKFTGMWKDATFVGNYYSHNNKRKGSLKLDQFSLDNLEEAIENKLIPLGEHFQTIVSEYLDTKKDLNLDLEIQKAQFRGMVANNIKTQVQWDAEHALLKLSALKFQNENQGWGGTIKSQFYDAVKNKKDPEHQIELISTSAQDTWSLQMQTQGFLEEALKKNLKGTLKARLTQDKISLLLPVKSEVDKFFQENALQEYTHLLGSYSTCFNPEKSFLDLNMEVHSGDWKVLGGWNLKSKTKISLYGTLNGEDELSLKGRADFSDTQCISQLLRNCLEKLNTKSTMEIGFSGNLQKLLVQIPDDGFSVELSKCVGAGQELKVRKSLKQNSSEKKQNLKSNLQRGL